MRLTFSLFLMIVMRIFLVCCFFTGWWRWQSWWCNVTTETSAWRLFVCCLWLLFWYSWWTTQEIFFWYVTLWLVTAPECSLGKWKPTYCASCRFSSSQSDEFLSNVTWSMKCHQKTSMLLLTSCLFFSFLYVPAASLLTSCF